MAYAPVAALSIMFLTWSFMGVLYGADFAAQSFTDFKQVDPGGCTFTLGGGIPILSDVGEATGYIGCVLANIGNLIFNVFAFIVGAGKFVFQLLTFNIPGAPGYIRIPISGMFVGVSVWSIATLSRGN